MTKRLENRIALITGASRGIGRAVAVRFAQEGAQLVLTARNVGGLEETDDLVRAAGGQATLVPLDLREFDKIDALGASLHERFGKLDVLVGNAAMLGDMTPVTHQDPKIWQQIVDINLTANWRLLRSLHVLLMASEAGRAMFVTSGVTQRPSPYWGAYAVTKTALEKLVETYAAEHAKTNLRVNLIDPGAVRTRMRAQAYPGEDPQTLPAPEAVTEVFVKMAEADVAASGSRVKAA